MHFVRSITNLTLGTLFTFKGGCNEKSVDRVCRLCAYFKRDGPRVRGTEGNRETIRYMAQGVTMVGYLAYDQDISGPRPGVLVVPEWWGLNDYARKRARMLAEIGYAALAVDMYGGGKVASNPEGAQGFSSELLKDFDTAAARFNAAMAVLRKQPVVDPARIAAIGYCFGGAIVLNMARQAADLKGVVSFHGTLTAAKPVQAGTIKAKILVLNGAADRFITPQQLEQFKEEMKAAGADFRVVSYPGAMHSFTNPDADALAKRFNLPIGYNADADKQSWEEMKRFLKDIFERSNTAVLPRARTLPPAP